MAETASAVFRTTLKYCLFILFAPIATFFFTKLAVFQGVFDSYSVSSNVWSAIAAVIVLHIALGMYIIRAYDDNKGKEKDGKDD